MSVQKILDLFGKEFDDRISFCKKIDKLFNVRRQEFDSALQSTELLKTILNSKFSIKQKIHLFNLSYVARQYFFKNIRENCNILPIYYSFREYMEDMTYLNSPVDPPFETYADIMYDVIQLLKILVKEKKMEKYKEDERVQVLARKHFFRKLLLCELGYETFGDEFWHELYLDDVSMARPQSVLYVLDTNPTFEYEYAKKPVVLAPDSRFQSFIDHYRDMLSEDRLLLDILNSPWDRIKFNRLFRLAGIVSRILIAKRYCNKTYVKKIHPLYDFFQEYMFETCARLGMESWLFKYDNLEPIGAELCDLFRTFVKENKQHKYKTDKRYQEFIKKYEPYTDQVSTLKKRYRKEDAKLVEEWYKN